MEVPAHQSNLRTNQEDERIELDDLLHTTTKNTESDETMPTTQTGEADNASVVEVPTTTEVDPDNASVVEVPITTEVDLESDAQKDSDVGDSDTQSCCTCGK